MPKLTAMDQEFVSLIPDFRDVNMRLRYARADGLLNRSAKDDLAPQIDTVHVLIGVLTCCGGGQQINVPRKVRDLFRLVRADILYFPSSKEHEHPAAEVPADLMFGQRVAAIIEGLLKPDGDAVVPGLAVFNSLHFWQNDTWASINYDGYSEHFGNLAENRRRVRELFPTDEDRSQYKTDFIETITTVSRGALLRLAGLVEQSRREAQRRGIEIPTDNAWKALGFAKPGPNLLAHPLVELSAGDA